MATNEEPIATQQATPLLRQISEPHAQALPEGQEEAVPPVRRLASDYLTELVRNADDSVVRDAAKPLGHVCKQELKTLCGSELKLLQVTFRVSNGQWNSPLMLEGLRNTQLCLATNSDELSLPCMDVIVTAFLKAQDRPSGGEMNDVWNQGALPTIANEADGKRGGDRKMRHHKHDHDSSDDQKPPMQGLEIYVINNNGGDADAIENAIGMGNHHKRHNRHHHHEHHHGTHPLVWMVVLPFFCIGVFVSVKHAVAYIKKRRGGNLPFATPSHEYEPLKATDSHPHE